MATLRTNAAEIKSFLTHLEFWLRFSARKWWPRFLFHFTDVNNLASILSCGKLYSRNLLRTFHPNFVDIASPGVIQNTSIEYQNYVRLYFRPRTPTQYRNEGIRPAKQRELNAHCSIPVFLLFDSYEILSRNDSRFSNGNLGRSSEVIVDGSIGFLKSLPFEKIYHDGTIPDTQDKREITFHRNAEVLIPDELDLSALRFIVCRSEAEKETLINMLQEDTRLIWLTKIIYNPKQFFYGRWTFVERVYKTESSIKFYFSPDSITPGPFRMKLQGVDLNTQSRFEYLDNDFFAYLTLLIELRESISDYECNFYLDDSLACKIVFHIDAPF